MGSAFSLREDEYHHNRSLTSFWRAKQQWDKGDYLRRAGGERPLYGAPEVRTRAHMRIPSVAQVESGPPLTPHGQCRGGKGVLKGRQAVHDGRRRVVLAARAFGW